MKVFEAKEDCPIVEKTIWRHVALDYGSDFCGIRELSFPDLLELRAMIDYQLSLKGASISDIHVTVDE